MTQEEARAIFKAHVDTAITEWMVSSNSNVLDADGMRWVVRRAKELTRSAMEYGGGSYRDNADGGFTIKH